MNIKSIRIQNVRTTTESYSLKRLRLRALTLKNSLVRYIAAPVATAGTAAFSCIHDVVLFDVAAIPVAAGLSGIIALGVKAARSYYRFESAVSSVVNVIKEHEGQLLGLQPVGLSFTAGARGAKPKTLLLDPGQAKLSDAHLEAEPIVAKESEDGELKQTTSLLLELKESDPIAFRRLTCGIRRSLTKDLWDAFYEYGQQTGLYDVFILNDYQLIGKIFGKKDRYRLDEKLTEGGMASIFKAWDQVGSKWVAVKILSAKFVDDKNVVGRFDNEGRVLSELSSPPHPNIIQVYERGSVGGRRYLVMELMDGGKIKDTTEANKALFLARNPGEAYRRTISIMKEVSKGLDELRKRGIVHRDITPGNLLFNRDGQVKIADFGISMTRGQALDPEGTDATLIQTKYGVFFGTPVYASPEQVLCKGIDFRSDIFSLGAVLYYLLTGSHIIENKGGVIQILLRTANWNTSDLTNLFAGNEHTIFNPILGKMLAPAPDDRYQDYESFISELEGVTEIPETVQVERII